MKVLAHRGFWKTADEKNSLCALERAFSAGFGIETDIRDYKGRLVISHNIADESSFALENVFDSYCSHGCPGTLALNVKADGIQDKLQALLDKYDIRDYFMFDMSIPEQVVYRDRGFTFFTRISDIETSPVQYEDASGIWMDGFYNTDWIDEKSIAAHLKNGKKVCLVSPELHGKPYDRLWNIIKTNGLHPDENLLLCTDVPDEAVKYFAM